MTDEQINKGQELSLKIGELPLSLQAACAETLLELFPDRLFKTVIQRAIQNRKNPAPDDIIARAANAILHNE